MASTGAHSAVGRRYGDSVIAPPVGFGLHLLRIDLEAIAPLALRSVERKVGIAQDLVDAFAVRGNKGDPDAAADDDRATVDLDRLIGRKRNARPEPVEGR